jgi:protein-S-isoprenylcysteine O-methyltransferase Ste14
MPEPDPLAEELDALRQSTGFQPLNKAWAKCEILFGLIAVGVGFVTALRLAKLPDDEVPWWMWAVPVLLITLGGYLALAGHRSHLYQSNIRLTAHLAQRLRQRG